MDHKPGGSLTDAESGAVGNGEPGSYGPVCTFCFVPETVDFDYSV